MPSVTRMSPTIRLDTRWVCPATMASTVVSGSELVGDGHDRAVPRRPAACRRRRWSRSRCPRGSRRPGPGRPGARAARDSAGSARRAGQERQALGRPGPHQLRRGLQRGADHADLDAVDAEHDRRRDPVGRLAGGLLDDVGGEEREVGPFLVASAAVRRRSRTRGCRTRWRRAPRRSRRRWPGMSSSRPEFGGDAPTLSPPASSSAGPGSVAASSSNIVARNAAPPTVALSPSVSSVVGSSWPWKSLSPMIVSGVTPLLPLTTRAAPGPASAAARGPASGRRSSGRCRWSAP